MTFIRLTKSHRHTHQHPEAQQVVDVKKKSESASSCSATTEKLYKTQRQTTFEIGVTASRQGQILDPEPEATVREWQEKSTQSTCDAHCAPARAFSNLPQSDAMATVDECVRPIPPALESLGRRSRRTKVQISCSYNNQLETDEMR